MGENSPLYHYTNVGVLALILKNRSIRFNSLDRMDDLQEQMTADVKNIGQFCYISAWTDDKEESIPMWNMYASLKSGVRISLKRNPFKVYENHPDELMRETGMPVQGDTGAGLKSIIPIADMFNKKFMSIQAMSMELLHKVEYTNDPDKLYPKLVSTDDKNTSVKMGELGKYKNLHWSFQREWRYIMLAFPLNLKQDPELSMKEFQMFVYDVVQGTAKQPFPYYDFVIDDEAFREMTITLSPCLSEGNRVIVHDLVEKYNPTARIIESTLKDLL